MAIRDLSGTTAIVTGAGRGFGRAISLSLAHRDAHVVGVGRTPGPLQQLKDELANNFTMEVTDVSDPSTAKRLLTSYRPQTVVLNAGATPVAAALQDQTWENFSVNWAVDVHQVFNFTREALSAPLPTGAVVVSMSSGAALRGSPLSGGYAGAKATIRFISEYAASEALRNALDVRFVAVLPQITADTDLGSIYVEAYARYGGVDVNTYLSRLGPRLSLEQVGQSITELTTNSDYTATAYLLNGSGLSPL
jgi:NAD(P)-dependent dehydrogenase (short-subunit alcohol dehydrogenase family)